jgi:hypothetical protein
MSSVRFSLFRAITVVGQACQGNTESGCPRLLAGSDLFDARLLPVANVPENIITARTGYFPGGPGEV